MASKPTQDRRSRVLERREERQRRGKESPASLFPYLSSGISWIWLRSRLSRTFHHRRSSHRGDVSRALPTVLCLRPSPPRVFSLCRSHNSPTTVFDLTKVDCSLFLSRERDLDRAMKGLITRRYGEWILSRAM